MPNWLYEWCRQWDKFWEEYFQGKELSPAIMEMARKELEELQRLSDEAFLIRADMDRRLVSL
jgi:hypothetical protein